VSLISLPPHKCESIPDFREIRPAVKLKHMGMKTERHICVHSVHIRQRTHNNIELTGKSLHTEFDKYGSDWGISARIGSVPLVRLAHEHSIGRSECKNRKSRLFKLRIRNENFM
jgi:hypothetical protein